MSYVASEHAKYNGQQSAFARPASTVHDNLISDEAGLTKREEFAKAAIAKATGAA